MDKSQVFSAKSMEDGPNHTTIKLAFEGRIQAMHLLAASRTQHLGRGFDPALGRLEESSRRRAHGLYTFRCKLRSCAPSFLLLQLTATASILPLTPNALDLQDGRQRNASIETEHAL